MISPAGEAHARLEKAVAAAEAKCSAGTWEDGFKDYLAIAAQLLGSETASGLEGTPLSGALALIFGRIAELALLLGHANPADRLLEGLVLACRRAGNEFAARCITLKRLHIAIGLGKRPGIEDALKELEPAIGRFDIIAFRDRELEAWEARCQIDPQNRPGSNAFFFTQFYLEAGRLFAWLGQYKDAVGALQKGLKHSIRAPQFTPALTLELAGVQIDQGKLAEAETTLAPLLAALEKEPSLGIAVRVRELEAQLRIIQGDFGKALMALDQVRALFEHAGLPRSEATAAANVAQLLILLNQTVAATDLLTPIAQAARHLNNPELSERVSRLITLAEARQTSSRDGLLIAPPASRYWRGQSAADTTEDQEGAEAKMTKFTHSEAGSFLERFNDYALGYQWLLDKKLTVRAQSCLVQMREIFASTDSPLIHLRMRILEAMQLYWEEAVVEAEQLFTAARVELRSLGLWHELWQASRFILWCQARLGQPPNADAEREAGDLLARMSTSLAAPDQVYFHLNKANAEEERLGARLNALILDARSAERLSWPRRWLARWRLKARVHTLELEAARGRDAAARHLLSLRESGDGGARPLWKRLLLHPRQRATVSFVVLPDQVLVVRTTFLSLAWGVSPVTRIRLRELVKAWHESLARMAQGSQKALQFSEAVGDALQFSELLAALPGCVRALTIFPDDVLHGVPFAALYNSTGFRQDAGGQPLRYVAEAFAVTMASPARSNSMARKPANLLAAGMSKAIGNFVELKQVPAELCAVAEWFVSQGVPASLLLNEQATPQAVARGLTQAAFAHIACHGDFQAGDLTQTGLIFHGGNGAPEILSLTELAKLDLSGLRHVTLASCWSADNYILPGRWILSLPQTLCTAGAQSVLSSLWPVADEISIAFMSRFYHYARGTGRDQALRLTQLDCLRNQLFKEGNLNSADAAYWAGFTLTGDAARLHLN